MSPGDSPSRITGCCRPCRNHPASSENSHVFAAATFRHTPAPRNRKNAPACAETVDEKPSLWKPEENRGRKPYCTFFAADLRGPTRMEIEPRLWPGAPFLASFARSGGFLSQRSRFRSERETGQKKSKVKAVPQDLSPWTRARCLIRGPSASL